MQRNYLEEEKVKAERIARQSQIKFVFDYTQAQGKTLDMKTLVAASEVLSDWIVNGYTTKIGERLQKLDDYIKTI